ncbi:hypothetical protein J6590_053037 [Homalodisca vitripennis]|nr:hypothetical protein J6590_053037 [Homalodisca vitripennis]
MLVSFTIEVLCCSGKNRRRPESQEAADGEKAARRCVARWKSVSAQAATLPSTHLRHEPPSPLLYTTTLLQPHFPLFYFHCYY